MTGVKSGNPDIRISGSQHLLADRDGWYAKCGMYRDSEGNEDYAWAVVWQSGDRDEEQASSSTIAEPRLGEIDWKLLL